MAELTEAGCVGFSQADVPLADTQVLQRALQYAATFGYTVWLRPQDAYLGAAASPPAARWRRGWAWPACRSIAETIALHTIFELVRATGARVHLCRLSQRRRRRAGARAPRREGLPVTCDVSINSAAPDRRRHRLLRRRNAPDAAAAPAARPRRDARRRWPTAPSTRSCSDHTPVDDDAKTLPFAEAEPGATGLELLLRAGAEMGRGRAAARSRRRWRASRSEPARVLGDALGSLAASAGRLVDGGVADLCVFDPAATLDGHARRRCAARASTRRSPATSCPAACAPRSSPGNVVYEA